MASLISCISVENENRNKEKAQLLISLKNSINTFVFGPDGIGKTTLMKSVVEDYNSKFGSAIYIDCSLYQTANAILRELLLSLGSVVASKSNYELIKRLKEKMKKSKPVIFLDHFENLKDTEILKMLLGLDSCICLVSDSFESHRKMSLFLRSRITNLVKISEFSKDDILIIMKEKLDSSKHESISETLLRRIVEKCGVNLAFTLNMLETAILKANGKNELNRIDLLEDNPLDEVSNDDHRIILQILQKSNRLQSGEIYRLYCERSEYPKSERSFRKYMQVLCKQGLVKSIGEKKGRSYEIIGKV